MNLNNSNSKFYLILILLILILLGIYVNFIKKRKEHFNNDQYYCSLESGCIFPPAGVASDEIITYDKCKDTCKFDFIDGKCQRDEKLSEYY